MKKIILITGLLTAIIACNDSGDNESTTTSSASAHQPDSPHTEQSIDTSGMAGKSMMSIMQSMMDNMKSIQSSGNPDNDFVNMMKAHHLGAIEMAQIEVAKGSDEQIKQMARKMMEDQQKEVAEFNTFLSGHTPHGGGDTYHKKALNIINSMKMDMDHAGSIDKQFAQMMIPHHQSAIDMSKAYLASGHEEKIKAMANNIIASQQKEIKDLQAWLDKTK
ncbi:MAG TPA: DUF305 domain-containing protein [Chitinophagaceae bacterium]|nr:DUF305 domain-containing protein [Chitinophagaceae bacterium]